MSDSAFFAIFAVKLPTVMRKTTAIVLLMFLSLGTVADNRHLLEELDEAISQKQQYIDRKNERIALLQKMLATESSTEGKLKTIDNLYDEYYVFRFDSALVYADRGLSMATAAADKFYTTLFTIRRAEILGSGGFYSEAQALLDAVDTETIDRRLLFKYYSTYFFICTYWAEYCKETSYWDRYHDCAANQLRMAMQNITPDDPLYHYYMGEYHSYAEHDEEKAFAGYTTMLAKADPESRVYAQTAYALASKYAQRGDSLRHEEHLIRAALCDIKSCTMETMALQEVALLLFRRGDADIERAERYINVAMEDAKFYNSRLRILEVSQILPQIMSTYRTMVERQNRNLRVSIGCISVLVVGLLCTAWFIYQQNRKLTARRKELADSNRRLTDVNSQLADLNDQLHELNQKLVDTNKRREGLASIYIDLCARYIDKLGKYQTLVKRKIKAHQEQELLQTISSVRMSEADANTFLSRFDKAFLELYPTFVDEFNALLTEDGRIEQKSPLTLTTELRTFALIRLGVKSTADIAGLLFLSTQTIYNCRSVTRSKAISKETFDDDVLRLCTVIHT